MEYEVRFYYPIEDVDRIIEMLSNESEVNKGPRTYEKTIQFNHCDPNYDFYSKEIDGRFRLRISLNDDNKSCKLSWKRRLKDTTSTDINKEEEKEVRINSEDIEDFMFIIGNVMHFSTVESYERYRTVFSNNDIEISVDEYPFGIALEIESKSETKDPEENIKYWVNKLGLNLEDSYRLSWDDKYKELCKAQNIPNYSEVTFDKEMPKVVKK